MIKVQCVYHVWKSSKGSYHYTQIAFANTTNKSEISLHKPGIFNGMPTSVEAVFFLWQETSIISVLRRLASGPVTTKI